MSKQSHETIIHGHWVSSHGALKIIAHHTNSYSVFYILLSIAMSIMLGQGCTITESPAVSVHQFSAWIDICLVNTFLHGCPYLIGNWLRSGSSESTILWNNVWVSVHSSSTVSWARCPAALYCYILRNHLKRVKMSSNWCHLAKNEWLNIRIKKKNNNVSQWRFLVTRK